MDQPRARPRERVDQHGDGARVVGEIATRLYLSLHTVKTHGSALYRKLEARNRAEAVTKAQRFGLID